MRAYRTLSQTAPVPNPGQGVVIRPSPIQRVKISSLVATFTASAALGNRLVFAQICDPNNVPVFETGSPTAIAPSAVSDFVLSTAFGQPCNIQGPVNAAVGLGIPNLWLPPSWSLKLNAIGLQAGDQFSAITYVAEFAKDIWDQEEEQAAALAFLSSLAT